MNRSVLQSSSQGDDYNGNRNSLQYLDSNVLLQGSLDCKRVSEMLPALFTPVRQGYFWGEGSRHLGRCIFGGSW